MMYYEKCNNIVYEEVHKVKYFQFAYQICSSLMEIIMCISEKVTTDAN